MGHAIGMEPSVVEQRRDEHVAATGRGEIQLAVVVEEHLDTVAEPL